MAFAAQVLSHQVKGRDLGLHGFFTKLMLILMVAGPYFWLESTEDAQHRTDLLLLSLSGIPEVNLALNRPNPRFDDAAFRQRFPRFELHF